MTPERLLTVIAKCKAERIKFILDFQEDLITLTPYICLYEYWVEPCMYGFMVTVKIT